MAREESFFDELARGLADGSVTRAKAIRLMGGALVGAALASVPGVAWANDRCPEGQTRCNDRCVNLNTNERHCGSCRNRCASTQTCCGGRCVNLKRSERHCGSCSNHCAEGEECMDGVCQGGCPSGTTPCGTGTSVTCCAEGQECVGGTCAASCPPDTKLCNNGQCANCCDNADCSGCATCQSGTCACPSGTVFVNGACARSCTGGASCPTGFCYGTDQGPFCAGGGSVGNCLGLGTAVCPTGSVCTGRDCLTVVC